MQNRVHLDAGRRFVSGQVVLGLMLVAVWWLFPARGWPLPAAALALSGVLLAIAAGIALGRSFRVEPEPHDEARLVRVGVYAWIRHPMYVGAILAAAAAAVSRPSWPVIVVALVNCAWYVLKAGFEEDRLLARYRDYADYRRSTIGLPTLLPRRRP